MESKGSHNKKQTSLNDFFPTKPKKNNAAMEIEPEIIIIEGTKSNSLDYLPLPHHNSKIWLSISPIFESFFSNQINSFPEFFKSLTILMSFGCGRGLNFSNLQIFFSLFSEKQKKNFFGQILPLLGSFALRIVEAFPTKTSLPRLIEGKFGSLELTKEKIACLIVHMFFCTIFFDEGRFNHLNKKKLNGYWNFQKIFKQTKNGSKNQAKIEKLWCIYHYFERLQNLPNLKITYIRVCSPIMTEKQWLDSSKKMKKVTIKAQGSIEDYIKDTIQLDFANKYLGGGVLNNGDVQEEIRFTINPELLPSMLLFDCLNDNEAAIMVGTEQYSAYKGYARTFKYDGDFQDPALKYDEWTKDVVILAIDATKYYDVSKQLLLNEMLRELNKAFIGFHGNEKYPEKGNKRAIATGRWGCGVFKGDSQLKFLIQWLACSQCEREMYFYPFNDKNLANLDTLIASFEGQSVGWIMNLLVESCKLIYYKKDKRMIFDIFFSLI